MWCRDPQASTDLSPLPNALWPPIFKAIILPTNYKPQANAALPDFQGSLQASASAMPSLQKLQGQVGQRAGGMEGELNSAKYLGQALRSSLS